MNVPSYVDIRIGPGLMLRAQRCLGGWVWQAPGGARTRYFFRRTTTASGWLVRAQAGRLERPVTSLRQCGLTAWQDWLKSQGVDRLAHRAVS